MKQLLTGLFLICAIASHSQQYNGYITGGFIGDFLKEDNSAIGGRIGGGGIAENKFLAGFAANVVKMKSLERTFVVLNADINVTDLTKKVFPIVSIQPGFSLFNSENGYGQKTTGSFCLYAGGGIMFSPSDNFRLNLQGGFTSYGFKVLEDIENTSGFGARLSFIYLSKK